MTIETEQYKGYTIHIEIDDNPESPRDWDNLGTMVCFHRRYNLGDSTHLRSEDFSGWAEVEKYLIEEEQAKVILPLYLYDHGGITMSVGSPSPYWHHAAWDSGMVGFIYVTAEKIKAEYGWKVLTKARREKIEKYLTNEVETYDHYLTGQVYGYVIKDPEGDVVESCWGFVGDDDYCLSEARGMVDYLVEAEEKRARQQREAELQQIKDLLGDYGHILGKNADGWVITIVFIPHVSAVVLHAPTLGQLITKIETAIQTFETIQQG